MEDVKKPEEKKEERYKLETDKEPVVTQHSITINGKPLNYTVTTGMMPIMNEIGEVEAGMFYIAYSKKGVRDHSRRPLMFSFNGGPGSSSVWLHLGAVGPKRTKMTEEGMLPKPPYQLVDNPHTWLQETDLVFIDPVGTGYSRPATKELGEKFWGLKGDIESIGEFIRLYLTRSERWSSPLFLVGESYGTTRAAGLSGYLVDLGIAFNGIVLVSSILNFITARNTKGNDLPALLFLPTYTATAWYHKKLAPGLQKSLKKTLSEVEAWAANDYIMALSKGSALPAKERKQVMEALSRYTGLDPQYIDNTDLRINIHNFCKELLRSEKRTVGRLDSRFKGMDASGVTANPDFDPSMSAIRPPYTAMLNDYIRRDLGYKTDTPYHILGGGINKDWNWGSAGEGHPDTSDALRTAFVKNPYMKVFIASGYYDLATPYFATMYTLDHMGLDASLRDNIATKYYEAGHMMYIHEKCLKELHGDVTVFLRNSY